MKIAMFSRLKGLLVHLPHVKCSFSIYLTLSVPLNISQLYHPLGKSPSPASPLTATRICVRFAPPINPDSSSRTVYVRLPVQKLSGMNRDLKAFNFTAHPSHTNPQRSTNITMEGSGPEAPGDRMDLDAVVRMSRSRVAG